VKGHFNLGRFAESNNPKIVHYRTLKAKTRNRNWKVIVEIQSDGIHDATVQLESVILIYRYYGHRIQLFITKLKDKMEVLEVSVV